MKQISSALLALVFVFFTLISLLSIEPTWEREHLALSEDGPKVSQVGLRVAFQR